MSGSHSHASNEADPRRQQLAELVEWYELGAVTHEEFERRKQDILLSDAGNQVPARPRAELIVATYLTRDQLQLSLEHLLTLSNAPHEALIDGAVFLRSGTGKVSVRAIAGLTRASDSDKLSVIVCLGGLLLSPEALQVDAAKPGWRESLRYMADLGLADSSLRQLGESVPHGAPSIAVMYWPSTADEIAAAFVGFDSFARRILSEPVVTALGGVLSQTSAEDRSE